MESIKFKTLFIIIGILLVIFFILNWNKEPTTVINDPMTYSKSWRLPVRSEYAEIAKLIVENNITICGEYHVKEITTSEYIIACTPDGINWEYFVAYTATGRFYRANDEMISKLKPPR